MTQSLKHSLILTLALGLIAPGWAALPGAPVSREFDDIANNGRVIAQVAQDIPPGKVGATLIFLDGQKFALGAMLSHDSGTPAVSLVQVYEAHSGGTRPARCK